VPLENVQIIHRFIEQYAGLSPGSTAIIYRDQSLSYAALDEKADRLGKYLVSAGVGPGDLVGIHFPSSPELIISMLAVLKTGAAFLPLDTTWPPERLNFMIADSSTRHVLAQHENALEKPGARVRFIHIDSGSIPDAPAGATLGQNGNISPDNTAYIIYTSGSTGRPKGVIVPHRGLVNVSQEQARLFEIGPENRVLQFSSCCFDASIFEIILALTHGAALVMGDRSRMMPGPDLHHFIAANKITTVVLTPSVLAVMPVEELPDLKTIMVAGEACSGDLVNRWASGREFFNLYGPTEATIWATAARLDTPTSHPGIGKPIRNTRILILDENLEKVPPGKPGEICIGGIGVTNGYVNRPEITRDKFIDHPLGNGGCEKLYRTGDLGSWKPDGSIQFHGRIDFQVKIRGHRIELEEIERVIEQHEEVNQCAVKIREMHGGDRRLTAFMTPTGKNGPSIEKMNAFCREQLPEFMVPSYFIVIQSMPISPTGKIDRDQLVTADLNLEHNVTDPPRNRTESELLAIYKELLGFDHMGIHDHFFQLGGHSLLATRLINMVHQTFRVELPFQALYENPTASGLGSLIQELPESRNPYHLPPLDASWSDRPAPLSLAQERVWYLHKLNPDIRAYHASALIWFEGDLVAEVLEQSLNAVLRRHEIFRTTFSEQDGHPAQIVHKPQEWRLPFLDLSSSPDTEKHDMLDSFTSRESREPFALDELPLVRWTLVRMSPGRHVLVHVEHHLVHDGWSFAILIRDMIEFYSAFHEGRPPALNELKMHFAEFSARQRLWMNSPGAERQLKFWVERLQDCPREINLPYDFARPSIQTFNGQSIRLDIGPELVSSLVPFSRDENSTLFVTLFTAFVTLLYRYSGQDDICVGTGIANRRWPDSEDLIGMIINNIVLRCDFSGNPTFSRMLERVQKNNLKAYANQDIPFDRVVEAVSPPRDPSRNPLFQVMFGAHDSPMPDLEMSGVRLRINEGLGNQSAKFDLVLIYIPRNIPTGIHDLSCDDAAITLIWEYNTDLFRSETIRQMTRYYHELLEQVSRRPDLRLDTIPLIPQETEKALLSQWEGIENRNRSELPVHRIIESGVECHPDSPAYRSNSREWTYLELNDRANQLAHALLGNGIGKNQPVGISMTPGFEFIISLLAVLKAGGAYVPLDPEYPLPRLKSMIEETGLDIMLTVSGHVGEFEPVCPTIIDVQSFEWPGTPRKNPDVDVDPADPAYMIFTSGSTGLPKGVTVLHRSITNLVMDTNYIRIDPTDRIAQLSNISFDAATFEIWGALLNGACLVDVPRETLLSHDSFSRLLDGQNITSLFITTTLFNQYARQDPAIFKGLRNVLFGGESCNPQSIREVMGHGPPENLVHVYGPTETTTFATWHRVDQVADNAETVPIGKPITNVRIYVLDKNQRPTAPGIPGELYVAGEGLARDYLNDPELTRAKFPEITLPDGSIERTYKTGDIVVWSRPSGLRFKHRIDNQVKLRGFRIELDEIRLALNNHQDVHDSILRIWKRHEGSPNLVAYVESGRTDPVFPGELKNHLKNNLPEYMIPGQVIVLKELPLNKNGKIDYPSLPEPEMEMQGAVDLFVEPRTPIESELVGIWMEVFDRERLSVHDNFFDLGGHSLLAMQILNRVNQVFNLQLPLSSILNNLTIAELASQIEGTGSRDNDHDSDVIPRQPDRPAHVLSHGQLSLFIQYIIYPNNPLYLISRAFHLTGPLSIPALQACTDELVERHESLRMIFRQGKPEPQVTIKNEVRTEIMLLDLPGRDRASAYPAIIRKHVENHKLLLEKGPPFLISLMKINPTEHILIITMHHIISDGWSMEIFFRELNQLYNSKMADNSTPLPGIQTRFTDFVAWQKDYLGDMQSRPEKDYWLKKLGDDLPELDLPIDFPRPEKLQNQGSIMSFEIPENLRPQIKKLCSGEHVTAFMTYLTLFKVVLHQYCRQTDIRVGIPTSGRNHVQLETVLGYFVEMLVIRTDLSGNPDLGTMLQRVKTSLLEAYRHHRIPFMELVKLINPPRRQNRSPIVDVLFNFVSYEGLNLSFRDIRSEPVHLDPGMAKYDLEVHFHETTGQTSLLVNYRTALFREDTIRNMFEHYVNLLGAAATDPRRPLSDLPVPNRHK
jgi:amino acid adenylation domain-containing protein